MSLLHEALRKAERARDDAQPPPRRPELSAVPLEIVPEPEAPPTPASLAFESDLPQDSTQPQAAKSSGGVDEEPPAPNRKRSFYIALGSSGIAAIAVAFWFWSELRPAPAAAKANVPRTMAAQPAPKPAPKPAPAPTSAELPGLPPMSPASAPAPEPPAGASPQPPAPARAAALPRLAAKEDIDTAPVLPPKPPAARTTPAMIHPRVQAGYAAYQSGDLALARAEYQGALRSDASNRDALLGIAAVESRAGRTSEAENAYRRLLQADPRDPHAHAGLLALSAQRSDPLQVESRVKNLLAADPEAGALHFTLGNQYARQGRWDEAQLAYAKACAADPGNPDFAFNRAVSLDHLRQRGAALGQYRLALELADARTAHFPREGARARIEQLSR